MTSDTVKALADRYFLKTADKILPPKPKEEEKPSAANTNTAQPDHVEKRKIWPRWKTQLFEELRPHSICIVGTDRNVICNVENEDGSWTQFGGNSGRMAMRADASLSGSWRDTVTPRFNNNPFFDVRVQLRFWTDTELHAKAFALFIPESMAKIADIAEPAKLKNGFIDVGYNFDLSFFELDLFARAEQTHMRLWDDEGLSQYLDQVSEQRLRNSGRGL